MAGPSRKDVTWRTMLALPLFFLLVIFWMLAVCVGLAADKIAGKNFSTDLTGV